MDFVVDTTSSCGRGMIRTHELMRQYFDDTVSLVNYWGPVQMCVFYIEYEYLPKGYKIIGDCERGYITMTVKNNANQLFRPGFLYPEADRFHFEDRIDDLVELVSLTFEAISSNKIFFLDLNNIQRRND